MLRNEMHACGVREIPLHGMKCASRMKFISRWEMNEFQASPE